MSSKTSIFQTATTTKKFINYLFFNRFKFVKSCYLKHDNCILNASYYVCQFYGNLVVV